MRVSLAAASLLLAFGLPPRVSAQPATVVDLAVEVPDGRLECLRGPTLRAAVQARVIGEGLTEPVAVAVTAQQLEDQRWRVRVGLAAADGALGARELVIEEAECASVADAIGLVVLLALQGPTERVAPMSVEELPAAAGAALAGPMPSAVPPPEPAEDSSVQDTPDTTEVPERAPSEVIVERPAHAGPSVIWGLGLSVGARVGILPDPSPTGAVHVVLDPVGGWRVRLTGLLSLPQRTEVADGEVRLIHAELRGAVCSPLLSAGALSVDGCGVLAAGLLGARASGFSVWNGSSTELTAALGLAAHLRQGLGRGVYLLVAAEADLALRRPTFYVLSPSDDQLDAYRPAVASLLLTLGLGVDFR